MKRTIEQETWLPVCLGIGPTKTLAKLANHLAKREPERGGVARLDDPAERSAQLAGIPVEEVWGVGPRLAARLARYGITTAGDLARADARLLRRESSVTLERTVRELNGLPCHALEPEAPARQQIVCSRSFGDRVRARGEVAGAVARHATRAAEKLRAEGLRARRLAVFIATSPFDRRFPYYANQAQSALLSPSDDTRALVALGQRLLESIWREGLPYAKAGVMLSDLEPAARSQGDLFAGARDKDQAARLMSAVDRINAAGRGRIVPARGLRQGGSRMRRGALSPGYMTRWSDLPVSH